MNKLLKRLVTAAMVVVMFTVSFGSSVPVQAAASTVTITYNANGGTVYATGPEGNKQTVQKNIFEKIVPPSIVRDGYVLIGFDRLKKALYPDYYHYDQWYKFSSNVTLYAVWAKKSEVYDRYGDVFSYGIDLGTISGTLNEFSTNNWVGQSEAAKKKKATKLVSAVAALYGLSRVPTVVKDMPKEFNQNNTKGLYDSDNNTLYINPKLFKTFDTKYGDEASLGYHMAGTIVHEMRHAYQIERAHNPRCRIDALYRYNLRHYVKIKYDGNGNCLNRSAYRSQILEAEAFGIESLVALYLK